MRKTLLAFGVFVISSTAFASDTKDNVIDIGVTVAGTYFATGGTEPMVGLSLDVNKFIGNLLDELDFDDPGKLAKMKAKYLESQKGKTDVPKADLVKALKAQLRDAIKASDWKVIYPGEGAMMSIKYTFADAGSSQDTLIMVPSRDSTSKFGSRSLLGVNFEVHFDASKVNGILKGYGVKLAHDDYIQGTKKSSTLKYVVDKDIATKVDSPLAKVKLLTVDGLGAPIQNQASRVNLTYGLRQIKTVASIFPIDERHYGTFDISSELSTLELDSEAVTKLSWDITMSSPSMVSFATRYVKPSVSTNQTFKRQFLRSEFGLRFGDKRAASQVSDTAKYFSSDNVFDPVSIDIGILGGMATDEPLTNVPRISNTAKTQVLGVVRLRLNSDDTGNTGLFGTTTGYYLPRQVLSGGAPANLRWAYDADFGVFIGPENSRFSAEYGFGYNIDNLFSAKTPTVKVSWTRKF